MGWPNVKTCSTRKRYSVSPTTSTFIVLRRLCTPSIWTDIDMFFSKHTSHLSESFWESIENLLDARSELIPGSISSQFIQGQAERFSRAILDKSSVFGNCMGLLTELPLESLGRAVIIVSWWHITAIKGISYWNIKQSIVQIVWYFMHTVLWKDGSRARHCTSEVVWMSRFLPW